MYVHLKEPSFECNLPVAKCLDKNMFKELRKKTSAFGSNLIEHIKQDTLEGNRLGWVNMDRGSVSEFSPLLVNMFTQAQIKRTQYHKLAELEITEQSNSKAVWCIELRRNFSNFPFLSSSSSDDASDVLELVQKFLLKHGFVQKDLADFEDEFKVQEWLKSSVGNCDRDSGVFVCEDES